MDAEIARLRFILKHKARLLSPDECLALLDALEQARKERETIRAARLEECEDLRETLFATYVQRDAAQQDAKDARALLEMMVTQNTYAVPLAWRNRIEAMLEKKI